MTEQVTMPDRFQLEVFGRDTGLSINSLSRNYDVPP
jgi:hypothetical protein